MMEPKAFRHVGEQEPEQGQGWPPMSTGSSVIVTVKRAVMTGIGQDRQDEHQRRPAGSRGIPQVQGQVRRWE